MTNNKKNINLILLFLFALFIRLGYIYFFVGFDSLPASDGKYFDQVALNLSEGNGFTIPPDNIPSARKPPVFTLFLALIYKIFGHSYSAARFFQSVIGALVPIIIYLTAESVFNERIGFIASFLSCIDPALTMFCGMLFSESLLTFIMLLFSLFLVKEIKKPGLINAVPAGIFLGLSLLTRPVFIFMFIFVFIWKFIITNDYKKTFTFSPILVLTAVLIMMPWSLRNYSVYKKFVPVTTTNGLALWLSSDPSSNGFISSRSPAPRFIPQKTETGERPYIDRADILLNDIAAGRNEKEADDLLKRMFFEKIKKSPLLFASLIPRKLIAFWDGFHIFSYFSPVVMKKKIFAVISYCLVFPFALAGVFIERKKWRDLSLFYFLILSLNLMGIIFYADYRLRLPVMPYFMILAAVTYNKILENYGKEKPVS